MARYITLQSINTLLLNKRHLRGNWKRPLANILVIQMGMLKAFPCRGVCSCRENGNSLLTGNVTHRRVCIRSFSEGWILMWAIHVNLRVQVTWNRYKKYSFIYGVQLQQLLHEAGYLAIVAPCRRSLLLLEYTPQFAPAFGKIYRTRLSERQNGAVATDFKIRGSVIWGRLNTVGAFGFR